MITEERIAHLVAELLNERTAKEHSANIRDVSIMPPAPDGVFADVWDVEFSYQHQVFRLTVSDVTKEFENGGEQDNA